MLTITALEVHSFLIILQITIKLLFKSGVNSFPSVTCFKMVVVVEGVYELGKLTLPVSTLE